MQPICQRCRDVILDRSAVRLVTVGRPDGRESRRLVVCLDCASRLVSYLTGRPAAEMATAAAE